MTWHRIYHGSVYVSYAKFDVEYFWGGAQGPMSSKTYPAGHDGEVFLSHKLQAVAWSPCGASTNFRINTGITAFKQQPFYEDSEIAIDSIDATVERGFRYYMQWRKC